MRTGSPASPHAVTFRAPLTALIGNLRLQKSQNHEKRGNGLMKVMKMRAQNLIQSDEKPKSGPLESMILRDLQNFLKRSPEFHLPAEQRSVRRRMVGQNTRWNELVHAVYSADADRLARASVWGNFPRPPRGVNRSTCPLLNHKITEKRGISPMKVRKTQAQKCVQRDGKAAKIMKIIKNNPRK